MNSKSNSGMSLVEIVVAIAVFGLIATSMASLSVIGFSGLYQGGERSQALALAQEAYEAVRTLRDNGWNNFTYSVTGVSQDGTSWSFNDEGTIDTIGDYTRTVSFSDVCRDGTTDDIVTCPNGYTDINSKLLTIDVTWDNLLGYGNTITKSAYITNWDYNEWVQDNWIGGSGQAIWSNTAKYDSSDKVNTNLFGQVQLAQIAASSDGVWVVAGGTTKRYTSDIEFSTGTMDAIEITGTGDTASLILSKSNLWAEHPDSQVVSDGLTGVDVLSQSDAWAVGKAGKILHFDGSDWAQYTDVGGSDLNGLAMVSSNDGWAIGQNGKIYHYNGTSWSQHTDTGSDTWRGIDDLSASSVWAVTDRGIIYHYNGSSWSLDTDTGRDNWRSVDILSANDGWAVGRNGAIVNYDGTTWSSVSSPTTEELKSVAMVSANDGWAVGKNGKIIRYDGTSWSSVSSPTTEELRSVDMVTTNDGWIVGKGGTFLHWGGSSWAAESSPTTKNVSSVKMVDSAFGWAVGDSGRIFVYDNFYETSGTFTSEIIDSGDTSTTWDLVNWVETLPSGSSITVATRTGNTASPDGSWSGWSGELSNSGGSSITSPSNRYLQFRITFNRGDNTGQTPQLDEINVIYNSPASSDKLNGLDIVNASDIWVVGDNGTILHFDGDNWSTVSSPTSSNLNAVDMVSANDGWAVGNGTILHYNGTSWSTVTSPTGTGLHDIQMVSSSEGWIAGYSGKILKYDGTSWSEFVDFGWRKNEGIDMWSSNLGWIVGESAKIYKYDGTDWNLEVDAGSGNLYGAVMLTSSDGWAVADNGRIYRYNGTSWPLETDVGTTKLYTVDVATVRAFAMGQGGNIYRYENGSWSEDPSPTNQRLNDVEMIDDFNGWAVGNNGTILKFTGDFAYETSGNLTSSAYNLTDNSPVETVSWTESIPTCTPVCDIQFQIRTASDNGGTPGTWTNWYGTDGTADYLTNATGDIVSSAVNGNQWVQYKTFLSGDGSHTPILSQVGVTYK